MGLILVLLASAFEISGVIGLKLFSQKSTIRNGILYIGGFSASLGVLLLSFSFLQVSVAYAMWVGIGTAGAVLVNMIFFGESRSLSRIVSLAAIIIGVVGLKALS
ncbi:DMT family transporter [Virgibacillus litoralis]|uniref:Paired small multidrug resistance pump n=1 Tax=Virgibacillus litoralis TaxID=578221 RepID=A0ABS4HJ22_9BACI|nr:SMR family transporter [Virgibacillus litoralis]MBP1950858.1 paired small multidrug resistance pump [Virgibacillus litoralis]